MKRKKFTNTENILSLEFIMTTSGYILRKNTLIQSITVQLVRHSSNLFLD
jgi:hypothetical protein